MRAIAQMRIVTPNPQSGSSHPNPDRLLFRPPIEQSDLPPHGERLQILVTDQGMVLAVGREIVIYRDSSTVFSPAWVMQTEARFSKSN